MLSGSETQNVTVYLSRSGKKGIDLEVDETETDLICRKMFVDKGVENGIRSTGMNIGFYVNPNFVNLDNCEDNHFKG